MLMIITTVIDGYKPRLLCPAATTMEINGWGKGHQGVYDQNDIDFPFLHESKISIKSEVRFAYNTLYICAMNPMIIGIAGGSGAGKTTFLRALTDHFDSHQLALVSQDNYYKPKELQQADENGIINFDLPSSIDHLHFVKDMEDLASGQSITKLEYNFNNPAWKPQPIEVHPAPVIVMEGLFVFHFSEIMNRLHYKVFLDAHIDLRLSRRIRRDSKQRGYPEHEVRYQWDNHVRPAELKYLEPHKSNCELVVDNSHSYDDGLSVLVEVIQKHLDNL